MKRKIKELTQTHGKLQNYEHKSLDQILGEDGSSKYKTLNIDKYIDYLNDLNKSDLQSHAATVGLLPIDNRDILCKRLIREFKKHTSSYTLPKLEKTEINLDKKAKDILSEGR